MMKKLPQFFQFQLLLVTLCCYFSANAQNPLWTKQQANSVQLPQNLTAAYYSYNVNNEALKKQLQAINSGYEHTITFPVNAYDILKFKVQETRVLSQNLANKYSYLKTYKGIALDGSGTTIRFTYMNDVGVSGIIEHKGHEKIEIHSESKSVYGFLPAAYTAFDCETEDKVKTQVTQFGMFNRDVNDGMLRQYRLALSVSGDYSQTFLDGSEANDQERKAKVLQAMANSINRLNGIFERDFGITMQLIDQTDQLIFLNPDTDPYSTRTALRSEIQATLNATISESEYDVGHLYHKENSVYGNAGCIACVCTSGMKNLAYSVHRSPETDGMNLLAAHEFGHQFGAYHTQSSSTCRSGNNSEVEPGSGSTIMSYAGICSPNVQQVPDDYFNYTSIRDVATWTIDNSNCATLIPTGNTAPVLTPGSDYTIPKSTAFVLEAQVTDADTDDVITYCWEQNDTGNPQSSRVPEATRVIGPMFRSYVPSLSRKRYFPKMEDVLVNNLTPTWEVVPSVARTLNFSMTARDNSILGGQTVADEVSLTVDGEAGPFTITSQNSADVVWTVGDNVTVTWDVANTNLPPINTSRVELLLSTDGGLTFPTTLLVTDNDGEATFNLGNVEATSNARLLLKAVDNVFFAVNAQEFEIEKSEFALLTDAVQRDICNTDTATFALEYKTFLEFEETVNLAVNNLPEGVTAVFSEDTFSGRVTEGEPFTLMLSDFESLASGTYTFDVVGTSASVQKIIALEFTLFSNTETTVVLTAPDDTAINQDRNITLVWDAVSNANAYQVQLSDTETFDTFIANADTTETLYNISNLENDTQYFWRVVTANPCGAVSTSDVFSFTTKCSVPSNLRVQQVFTNALDIVWSDTETPSSWAVEYGLSAFTQGEGTTVIATSKQLLVEDLASDTAYDFYIRGNCENGGVSPVIGPFTVRTAINYCENNKFYDSGGPTGNYADRENTTTYMVPDGEDERVRVVFNSFDLETCCDLLTVYNGGNTSSPVLGAFRSNPGTLVANNEEGALTFVFTSDVSVTRSGWDATVYCEPKPNCTPPINFEVDVVEDRLAQLSWVSSGIESNWTIEYGLENFIQGEGETIVVDTNNPTLDNLEPGTSYDVYVKANCTEGGFSDVVGPLKFTTTINFCEEGRFYDSGGADGNYTNNENTTTVITPEKIGDRVRVVFDNFNIESCCDRLSVYDGLDVSAPLIGTYSFNPGTITPSNTDGALTFVFVSDGSVTGSGWDARVICEQHCLKAENFRALDVSKTTANLVWDVPTDETSWTIEYGLEGFSEGQGEVLNTAENSIILTNLIAATTYDVYITSNCSNGESNRTDTPIKVLTLCDLENDPNSRDLIVNGSFECGNLSGWQLSGPNTFSGCSYNFEVRQDSESVCSIVQNIAPTEGSFAAFTSFDSGQANTTYSVSQAINIPEGIANSESAVFSLDFKVNYRMTYNNPTVQRVFTIKFENEAAVELFTIEQIRFGLTPDSGSIDVTVTKDVLQNLIDYAGQTIILKINAFVPESLTGPSKALIDNISLTLDDTFSVTSLEQQTDGIFVYPVVNKGTFTIQNTSGKLLEEVTVYDVSGRLIQNITLDSKTVKTGVTLKAMDTGVYFVKMRVENIYYSKRIVIK